MTIYTLKNIIQLNLKIMTTKQYVKKYKLQEPVHHISFDQFLNDFIEEFDTRIRVTIESRAKVGLEFSYNIFQGLIREMQNKFWAISAKTVGGPLPDTLWNAFFAKGVITRRAQFFPKEHEEINLRRQAILAKKEAEQKSEDPKEA